MKSELRVYYKDGGMECYPVTFSNINYVRNISENVLKKTLFTCVSETEYTETDFNCQ